MKIINFICALAVLIPMSVFANENNRGLNPLVQLNNVRISMQRMLKSTDDKYFLSLFAGVPNPHASLMDLSNQHTVELKGIQKGNDLLLNAVPLAESNQNEAVNSLSGLLNANSGVFRGTIERDQTFSTIEFVPAIKVENKPLFIFKFFGVKADTPAQEQLLTRVDVINKLNNSLVQSLTGFSAFPNSVGYMDINFDGYYDVILSDLSQDRTVADKRFIYWMYNPKTQKFQRSSQLEKIAGFPKLNGAKQQIDFGNGQLYQVKNGLLTSISY